MLKASTLLTMLFASTILLNSANAQETELPDITQHFDLSAAMESDIFSAALSWNRLHGVGNTNNFRIGYGIRFSGFTGLNPLNYQTAPASLTSDNETIDTFLVNDALTMGLSAVLNLEYAFSRKWAAGFNIDVVGVGIGPDKTGTFVSLQEGVENSNVQASPTPFNLLIMGDFDWGHLKSEFYAAYYVTERFRVKGGFDMTFSEYTTNEKMLHDNDRFRYKAMMLFAGISFNPF